MGRNKKSYRRIPGGVIKIDLPNSCQQETYTCGPAVFLSICAYYGVGPEEEYEVEDDMGIDEEGTDPEHLRHAATMYGLRWKEYRGMTNRELIRSLDQRRPVMLMVQAWRDWKRREPRSYRKRWSDGHWIVAIGYDRQGVYVEDPSLCASRGYLTFPDLEARWHDIEGAHEEHTDHYGLAVWADRRAPRFAYDLSARIVD